MIGLGSQLTIQLSLSVFIMIPLLLLAKIVWVFHTHSHSRYLELRFVIVICYANLSYLLGNLFQVSSYYWIDYPLWVTALFYFTEVYASFCMMFFATIVGYSSYRSVFEEKFNLMTIKTRCYIFGFIAPLFLTLLMVLSFTLTKYEKLGRQKHLTLFIESSVLILLPMFCIFLTAYYYVKLYRYLKSRSNNVVFLRHLKRLLFFPLVMIFCGFWPFVTSLAAELQSVRKILLTLKILSIVFVSVMGYLNSYVYSQSFNRKTFKTDYTSSSDTSTLLFSQEIFAENELTKELEQPLSQTFSRSAESRPPSAITF